MRTTLNQDLLAQTLSAVRTQSPLVHNITNYVTMNNSANALLAIGASPVMAHWSEEMEAMTAIAGALVVNIGTLDSAWVESMLTAGRAASRRGTPIVLDPVGAGATPQRTATALRIIEECRPTVIRGNGSEIMALVDAEVKSKGVDSSQSSHDALSAAGVLARKTSAIVVISGEVDYITDGTTIHTVEGGDKMMTSVTAMGCTASALVGAFVAVCPDTLTAATAAMAVMSLAGERAVAYSKGSGSLQVNFLDELYNLTPDTL